MPGGNFNGVQNKYVPGVYTDTRGQFIPANTNTRGVTYFKYNMHWFDVSTDDQLAYVEMTRDQFYSNDSFALIGATFNDGSELSKLCEVVFRGSYRVVVDPITGTGMVKATGTSEDITVTAKKYGTFGNTLSVAAIQDSVINTLYEVKVYSDGNLIESYSGVNSVDAFNELSSFVTITGTLAAFASISLTGGADATITQTPATIVEEIIDAIEAYPIINSVFIADATLSDSCSQLLQQRLDYILENEGIRVIHNYVGSYTADSRRAFRIDTDGWVTADGIEYNVIDFMGLVAGYNAGLPPDESMTYMRVGGVRRLKKATTSDIASKLRQGITCLLQLYEDDGPYVVIADDINTLTTYTTDQPEFMRDGNITRIEDDVVYNVQQIGERLIIGQVRNTPPGRAILHSKIADYLTTLLELQVLSEFVPARDLQVFPGTQPNGVLVKYWLRIAGVIKYIYNEVTIISEEAA